MTRTETPTNLTDGGEAPLMPVAERFAHMLKPIQSAAANWNIDITDELKTYLEEYVNELTDFDFAGAGLMLQASGHVYCRKVDHLLKTLYDVLPSFQTTNLKAKKQRAAGDGEEEDGGPEIDDDDGLDGGKGKKGKKGSGRHQFSNDLMDMKWLNKGSNLYFPAVKPDFNECMARHYKPQMPMSLLPLENYEKTDVPLWPKKGESTGRKDDFRVNSCLLHGTGTLLLQSDNAQLIGAIDGGMAHLPTIVNDDINEVVKPRYLPDEMAMPGSSQHAATAPLSDSVDNDYGPEPMDMDDGYQAPTGEPDGTIAGRQLDDDDHTLMDGTVAVGAQRAARKKRSELDEFIALIDDPPDDKWLDPTEVTGVKRPIKVKKSVKISEKQRQKALKIKLEEDHCTKEEFDLYGTTSTISSYINTQFYSARAQLQKKKLRNIIYPGVEQAVIKKAKLMQELVRLWMKEEMPDMGYEIAPQAVPDDDDYGGADGDYDDDDDDVMPNAELGDADLMPVIDVATDIPNTNEMMFAEQENGDPQQPPICRTYEELLNWHLDQHVKRCGLSAKQTELSRRVSMWHQEVIKRLDADETRRKFVVPVYAQEVVDALRREDRESGIEGCGSHRFIHVFAGTDRRETCRYFLSSLFCANRHVVQVTCDDETITNSMRLMRLKQDDMPVDLGVEA